jgi:hypothetical protein
VEEKKARIVVKSHERRLVYGEVYAPLRVDTDAEAMTADEIEKMAHNFLASGRTDKIDVQHGFKESGCMVVESFIARKDDPDGFVEGAWVLGVKVLPDALWEAVKSGELNGFSFAGNLGNRIETRSVVMMTRRLEGETEKSADSGPLPPHEHHLSLALDHNGRIIPTESGETLGHRHNIRKATATEPEFDHAHRMILIQNE